MLLPEQKRKLTNALVRQWIMNLDDHEFCSSIGVCLSPHNRILIANQALRDSVVGFVTGMIVLFQLPQHEAHLLAFELLEETSNLIRRVQAEKAPVEESEPERKITPFDGLPPFPGLDLP